MDQITHPLARTTHAKAHGLTRVARILDDIRTMAGETNMINYGSRKIRIARLTQLAKTELDMAVNEMITYVREQQTACNLCGRKPQEG